MTSSSAITAPFTFSQSSLADFDRCRRRFWLRYVENLEWPAIAVTRDWEQNLLIRRRFHRLLHQHHLGVDVAAVVEAEPAGSPLREWWGAFQRFPPPGLDGATWPEVTLSTPLAGHRLMARFDLLVGGPEGALTIIDWKTGQPPAVDQLREGWQTLVYQYVAAVAGAPYGADGPNGVAAAPALDAMRMVYWFADYPASPVILPYGAARHAEAERRLAAAIEQIAALSPAEFTLCDDEAICRHCPFGTYCRRAPARLDLDDDDYPDIGSEEWDPSDIPEYEY